MNDSTTILLSFSAGLLLFVLVFRRRLRRPVKFHPRSVVGVLLLLLAAGFGLPFATGHYGADDANVATLPGGGVTAIMGPQVTREPLQIGDLVPNLQELTVAGWVNGAPPLRWGESENLIVLDLWADWCPLCREAAPGLVEVYQKYRRRGVVFVSLTTGMRPSAERFVRSFRVPWSSGFGLSLDSANRFGVYTPSTTPGYELMPTLFVLDGDGTVLWTDGSLRPGHVDPETIRSRLSEAISNALGDKQPSQAPP